MRGEVGASCVGIYNQVGLTLSSVLFPPCTLQSHSPLQHSAFHGGLECGLTHGNTANNSNNCSS